MGPDGTVWFSIEHIGPVSFAGTRFVRIDVSALKLGALDLPVDPYGQITHYSTGTA